MLTPELYMHVIARTAPWAQMIEIAVFCDSRGNEKPSLGKIVLEEVHNGSEIHPACRLTKTQAQELMDTLYQCGIRPTDAAGSAGSMAATQRHLEDMRKIAFGCLKDTIASE